eukprot:PhM_4_TR8191/c0_g1_i1/m.82008
MPSTPLSSRGGGVGGPRPTLAAARRISTTSAFVPYTASTEPTMEPMVERHLGDNLAASCGDHHLSSSGGTVVPSASQTHFYNVDLLSPLATNCGTYEGVYGPSGMRHGHGTMWYHRQNEANDSAATCWYEGEWRNDMRHGHGTYVSPNDGIYVGEFAEDQRHGVGTWVRGDHVYHGTFSHDALDGPAVVTSTNPDTGVSTQYTAAFENGNQVQASEPTVLSSEGEAVQPRTPIVNTLRAVRALVSSLNSNPSNPALPQQQDGSASRRASEGAANSRHLPPSPGVSPQLRPQVSPRVAPATRTNPNRMTMPAQTGDIMLPIPPPPPQQQSSCTAATSLAIEHIMSVCGPNVARFRWSLCLRYVAMHVFPFLFLPKCFLAPTALELEREYVVSGARIRTDFEVPRSSLIVSAISFVLIAVMLGLYGDASRDDLPPLTPHSTVSRYDIVAPVALYAVHCVYSAVYNSLPRQSHSLERLSGRQLQNLVMMVCRSIDPYARITVYAWDEEGYFFHTKPSFVRYWIIVATVLGSAWALTPMISRIAKGDYAFANPDEDDHVCINVFSMLAIGVLGTRMIYVLCKSVDAQRHVHAQLSVLSRAARVDGEAIVDPCDHSPLSFELTYTDDTDCLFEESPATATTTTTTCRAGFQSWFLCRCFIMYASVASNHNARCHGISLVAAAVVVVTVICCGDALHFVAVDNAENDLTTSHIVALFFLVVIGHFFLFFLQVCLRIVNHLQMHINLMLLTSANLECSSVVSDRARRHAGLIRAHTTILQFNDIVPFVLGFAVTPSVFLAMAFVVYLGIGAVVFRIVYASDT